MNARSLSCLFGLLVSTLVAPAQGTLLDCSCLSTQAVLLTNACQAVLPDLCLLTNCIGNSAVAPADLSCSQGPAPGTPVGPGVHPITVTIIDLNGTPLSCTVLFQVVPLPACRFTLLCASNQTVECGAPWSFTPPVWTNACAPPLGTPSNGVVLTVVSTVTNSVCPTVITRTWQAVDDCQQVATCSQKITVVDTTPPILDCACLTNTAAFPPLSLVLTNCTATIPDLCPRALACASDNCGPPTCTQSPPAGTPVGPGSHSITVTVTDCAGNTATCSVTLVVVAPTGIRVWNTGMTGLLGNIPVPSGTPELNYTLVSGPAPCAGPAIVLNGPPAGNLVNTAVSKWIAPIPAGAPFCPSGLYHYRLRFVLGCTNGASLTGRLASDDQAQVYLNNQWIAVSSSYTTWTNFSVSSGFVPGTNTIDILLTNVPCCTGLRVEMTNQFTCCCPQAVALQCPSQPVRAWVCPGNGPVRVPYTVTATSLCAPAGGTPTVTCLPPSPGPFPPGVTTVTCTATDALGNVNSCSFPVSVVVDTVPPVISCPAPITVSTCDPAVTVRYKARASDDCSTATVTCVPPSGSSFPAGTVTSVTCTAVDACGNSATCSFPVRVMNNLIWQLFARGADDCYAAAYEPTAPGPVLAATYPGLPWKAFDDPTPNRGVGVLWSGLPTNAIDGWVNTRVRPVLCRSFSGTQNDIIALGLPNVGGPWQWLRYFGQGNGPAGLLAADWCDQTNGCTTPFWISLLTPPITSGPPPTLLSNLNALARLDMFVQDDTRVDFAHLWLRRCAPPAILGGFPTVLNNARVANGPRGVWCIIRDLPTVNPWTARMELGAVPAVALPLRHRARSAEVRLALGAAFRPETARSLPGIAIVHAGDEAPLAELRLTTVPAGLTEVEVTRLAQGAELDTQRVPAGEGAVLAAFSPDAELLGATLSARGAVLEFASTNGEPGTQIRLRYLPEPAAEPIGELVVETLGVDALDVGDPQVRGETDALLVTVGGDALARADGGQVSLSALDPVDGAPLALAVRRAGPARVTVRLQQEVVLTRVAEPQVVSYLPTQEVAVAVQAVLHEPPGTIPRTSRELTFSPVGVQADGSLAQVRPEMTFRWRRDAGRYEVQAGDLDGDGQPDVLSSVEIWSHATLVALVPNPGRVDVEALPALYRVSLSSWRVDADLCHRFPWNRAERVWVNDVAYDATELRVNQQPFGAVAERPAGWAGVDVWAAGFDALVLDRAMVGAPQGRFHPPLWFRAPATGQASDLWLGWDLPGLLLESAPSVHGPWLPVPTEGTEAGVSPTQSRQFFRLRE